MLLHLRAQGSALLPARAFSATPTVFGRVTESKEIPRTRNVSSLTPSPPCFRVCSSLSVSSHGHTANSIQCSQRSFHTNFYLMERKTLMITPSGFSRAVWTRRYPPARSLGCCFLLFKKHSSWQIKTAQLDYKDFICCFVQYNT